jgi:hypothetical protein
MFRSVQSWTQAAQLTVRSCFYTPLGRLGACSLQVVSYLKYRPVTVRGDRSSYEFMSSYEGRLSVYLNATIAVDWRTTDAIDYNLKRGSYV